MRDLAKESVRRSLDLITVLLVKWHRLLAGIQIDFLNSQCYRAGLQFLQDGVSDAVTSLGLVDRHVTNLSSIFGYAM